MATIHKEKGERRVEKKPSVRTEESPRGTLARALEKAKVANEIGTTAGWRHVTLAMLEFEGGYVMFNGRFGKNESMKQLEKMAFSRDSLDRVKASLALGAMRVDFPEFADREGFPMLAKWVDEMLIMLGTDKDRWVRDHATLALNMKKTIASQGLMELNGMKD